MSFFNESRASRGLATSENKTALTVIKNGKMKSQERQHVCILNFSSPSLKLLSLFLICKHNTTHGNILLFTYTNLLSLICKNITHEKYFTVQTKVGDDEFEEIFNNKTDLTNQENVTSNEGRIVSEKLKDRKCEKVRASKRKERKGEKRREKD